MVVLNLNKVNARYINGKGIENISFNINRGEFVALLGHNGAGKSTLLNSIVGIKEFEGEINLEYKYKDIGYVSQKQVIDWYLNVESNIVMEAVILSKNDKILFDEIVELLELKSLLNNPIEELSGGQLQRVQIARAILKNPMLYILDEPTSGLDVYASEKVLKYLKELSNKGKTIIISSHDLEIIEKYCDRLLILSKGKLIYDGDINSFTKSQSLRQKFLEGLQNEE